MGLLDRVVIVVGAVLNGEVGADETSTDRRLGPDRTHGVTCLRQGGVAASLCSAEQSMSSPKPARSPKREMGAIGRWFYEIVHAFGYDTI